MQSSCTATLQADKFNNNDATPADNWRNPYLPPYSPSLRLEAILPEPPILMRGRGTPVRLILHTPAEVLQHGNIYVRSINMQLQSSATATVRPSSPLLVHDRRGCLIVGMVPVATDILELDLGEWKKFTVIQSKPTLKSCLLNLEYSLNITVGISKGTGCHIEV